MSPENRFDKAVQQREIAAQRRIQATQERAALEQKIEAEKVLQRKRALLSHETHKREGTAPAEIFSENDAELCQEFIEHMANKGFAHSSVLEDTMPSGRVPRPGLLGALEVTTMEWGKVVWRGRGYPIGRYQHPIHTGAQRNLFLCTDGLLRMRVPLAIKSLTTGQVHTFPDVTTHLAVPPGSKVSTGHYETETYYTEEYGNRSSGYQNDWGMVRTEHKRDVFKSEPLKSILSEIAFGTEPTR